MKAIQLWKKTSVFNKGWS